MASNFYRSYFIDIKIFEEIFSHKKFQKLIYKKD